MKENRNKWTKSFFLKGGGEEIYEGIKKAKKDERRFFFFKDEKEGKRKTTERKEEEREKERDKKTSTKGNLPISISRFPHSYRSLHTLQKCTPTRLQTPDHFLHAKRTQLTHKRTKHNNQQNYGQAKTKVAE